MRAALLLLALLLVTPVLAGPPPEVADAWTRGVAAYGDERYDEAVAAFEAVRKAGWTAPALEYNLGNAYLKADSLGRAVLHFRRALALDPIYENASVNLDYARSLTRDVRPETGRRWPWLQRLRLGPGGAALAVLVAFTLFCGIAALRLRRWGGRLTLVQGAAGGLLMLAVAALVFELSLTRGPGEGVVLVEETEVRAGPGPGHTVNFRIHEGTEVELLRDAPGWREVRVTEGLTGWLPEDAVEAIRHGT
jgi:tetratricopeptide (TPR) repeat protein